MSGITLFQNKYSMLLGLKKKTDASLRRFFIKKDNFVNPTQTNSILNLTNLNIGGGEKDLSTNFDKYLYS